MIIKWLITKVFQRYLQRTQPFASKETKTLRNRKRHVRKDT